MPRNSPKWLYLPDGWINMEHIIYNTKTWRVEVYGGRGSGKTYGTFRALLEHGTTFLYLRRTDTQYKVISNPETSPINSLNRDMGWNYYPYRENDKISSIYDTEENENGKRVPKGNPVGYFSSVLSFYNVRGIDLSRVEVIVFDEFVSESHVNKKAGEFEALLNLYETVNRNRELKGQHPVKLIMLANTDTVYNPYFVGWKQINTVIRMKRSGVDYYIHPQGYYTLIATDNSPISEKKAQTAFYKETEGTSFHDMAIESALDYKPGPQVKPRPIKEYNPWYTMGEVTVYKHKSRPEFYITEFRCGSQPVFEDSKAGKKSQYFYDFRGVLQAYLNIRAGWKVYFETPENEIYFKLWYDLT